MSEYYTCPHSTEVPELEEPTGFDAPVEGGVDNATRECFSNGDSARWSHWRNRRQPYSRHRWSRHAYPFQQRFHPFNDSVYKHYWPYYYYVPSEYYTPTRLYGPLDQAGATSTPSMTPAEEGGAEGFSVKFGSWNQYVLIAALVIMIIISMYMTRSKGTTTTNFGTGTNFNI